jgi:hypothetical protein
VRGEKVEKSTTHNAERIGGGLGGVSDMVSRGGNWLFDCMEGSRLGPRSPQKVDGNVF